MRLPWTLTVTGYGFAGHTFAQIAETCVAAGIAGIEGAPPLVAELSDAQIESGAGEFRDAGLEMETFHLPFDAHLDIASFYRTVREQAVEELKPWIARVGAAGANVAILHPTTSRYDVDVEGLDAYAAAIGASLEELLRVAADHGVTLAVENMLPIAGGMGWRFTSRPEHLERIRNTSSHPNLGFCLDAGHALVAGGPDGAHAIFEAMGSKVVAFHLQDTAGDRDVHIAPGRGLVDWPRVFRHAQEIGYRGTMCIETGPFCHVQRGRFTVEDWRGLVEDTKALVEQALS